MHPLASLLALATTLALGLACKPKSDTAPPEPTDDDGVMCTMDAKICPDGSAVGRSGPDCEFDPCPGELDDTGSDPIDSDETELEDEP
jgi:hypothetical protein